MQVLVYAVYLIQNNPEFVGEAKMKCHLTVHCRWQHSFGAVASCEVCMTYLAEPFACMHGIAVHPLSAII